MSHVSLGSANAQPSNSVKRYGYKLKYKLLKRCIKEIVLVRISELHEYNLMFLNYNHIKILTNL